MKFVEIYSIQNDGTQKVTAVCRLTDDAGVVCEGDEALVKNLNDRGIPDYSGTEQKTLFPKDGAPFLEGLCLALRSGYLNASEVKEE